MDEIVFSDLYSKSIDVIILYILKGNTKEEIEDEVDEKIKKIVNFI